MSGSKPDDSWRITVDDIVNAVEAPPVYRAPVPFRSRKIEVGIGISSLATDPVRRRRRPYSPGSRPKGGRVYGGGSKKYVGLRDPAHRSRRPELTDAFLKESRKKREESAFVNRVVLLISGCIQERRSAVRDRAVRKLRLLRRRGGSEVTELMREAFDRHALTCPLMDRGRIQGLRDVVIGVPRDASV